jgi:putative ABC transport system permease protein
MFSSMWQDFSFAIRQVRRSPGFACMAVLTLALGIGASAAVFSLVDGILLRPLSFPNAKRLVAINTLEFAAGVTSTNPEAGYPMGSSYPNFFDWQRQNHSFDSLASCDQITRLFSKPNGDGARVLDGARVSVNLFSTLGVTTALGRTFTPEEEKPGHRVVILSHELWLSDFTGSPSALGQTVNISDVPYTIIGIMPAGFHYPVDHPASYWSTFSIDSEGPEPLTSQRETDQLSVVGRLKAGVEMEQALADLNTIQGALSQQYSENRSRPGVLMESMLDGAVSDARSGLIFLFAAVGVVLVIGCANVAGLLLARASTRRGEVAVRVALGANRARLLRQFLSESLLLAVAGGTVGVPLSFLLLRLGLQIVPFDLPRVYAVGMDGRVLTFAILLSASTALMFGLLPAWKVSQLSPAAGLRDGGMTMTSGRGRNRLHHGLVVVETALGFALLIGSGLLIRTVVNVLSLRPGFDTERTVAFDIAITNQRYSPARKVLFFDQLLPQLAALPGVNMVSAAHPLPFRWPVSASFTIAGHVNSQDDLPSAGATVAEPGYFETLSIPLVRGRTFSAHDNDAKSAPVAIINQNFARQFFPGEDPIGRYFTPRFEHRDKAMIARQIVGIVGDTRTPDLWNPYPYEPQFYLPYAQEPTHQRPLVVMKVAGNPWSYGDTVRKIVAGLDKNAPVFGYRPLAVDVQYQAAHQRFEATLVSGFAGIALLLSAIGLYAVLSYVVAERTRELGLRMALGASRSDVLTLVLRRGLLLAGLGIGVGALSSVIMGRLITSLLFGVAPLDPQVFGSVILVFILVSIAATLMPAIRAAGLDPIRTLREQ